MLSMRGRFSRWVVATSAAVRSAQWMPPCSRSSCRRRVQHAGDVDVHAADRGAGAALRATPEVVALEHGVDLAGEDQPDDAPRARGRARGRSGSSRCRCRTGSRSRTPASSASNCVDHRLRVRGGLSDAATGLTSCAGAGGGAREGRVGADQSHLVLDDASSKLVADGPWRGTGGCAGRRSGGRRRRGARARAAAACRPPPAPLRRSSSARARSCRRVRYWQRPSAQPARNTPAAPRRAASTMCSALTRPRHGSSMSRTSSGYLSRRWPARPMAAPAHSLQ